MAITERITLAPISHDLNLSNELPKVMPGLRVMARTTSSSLADYPTWELSERFGRKDNLVTDGTAS